MELWRHKLSDITSYFRQKCRHSFKIFRLFTLFQQSSVPTFASFHRVDRDLQKYRHLHTSFTYDVIDVSLRRTINYMVSNEKANYTSGTSLKRKPLGPQNSVRFMEVSALQRLLAQKTKKLVQNICPLYRECPLHGVSVLKRFHCTCKVSTSYHKYKYRILTCQKGCIEPPHTSLNLC